MPPDDKPTVKLPDPSKIPPDMRSLRRWIAWDLSPDGKKLPKQRINDPGSWLSLDEVLAHPGTGGIGFVFCDDDDIGGIDLDACRDPQTGTLTEWAQIIVKQFNAYTEISPSGTGVKIFTRGVPPKLPAHVIPMVGPKIGEKAPHAEFYSTGRYFAVTGDALPDVDGSAPLADRAGIWLNYSEQLQKMKKASTSLALHPDVQEPGKKGKRSEQGSRNNRLASEAGRLRRTGLDGQAFIDAVRDLNTRLCDPPLDDNEVVSIARSVMRYQPHEQGEWDTNAKGGLIGNSQANLTLAFEKLNVSFSYDLFNEKSMITKPIHLVSDDPSPMVTEVLQDHHSRRMFFVIDRLFHLSPSQEYFKEFILDKCREHEFHPVLNYLNKLQWDGVKRIDDWLIKYVGAEDDEEGYTRAVGAKFLLAAVRRVKKPGVKFDEMVVLEGPQNLGKSRMVRALGVMDAWFSDSLPLGADPKVVIEQTVGKWILEASELVKYRAKENEALKNFLSRQYETARTAYARESLTRPRHFVIIGTTNESYYLSDPTGNRRYWPVLCTNIDVDGVLRDRDQLWAEACVREATGEDIFLPKSLWHVATEKQKRRELIDEWEETLLSVLGSRGGWVRTIAVWQAWGKPMGQITQQDSNRLGRILKKLGFFRYKRRFKGHGVVAIWIRQDAGSERDPLTLPAILRDDVQWEQDGEHMEEAETKQEPLI